MCKRDSENINHLFLHCPVARKLWCRLFLLGGEEWVMPGCVESWLTIHFWGFGRGKKAVVLWKCAFLVVFWVLWNERNSRIFEDKESSSADLWDKVHFLAAFWAHSSKEFRKIPLFVLNSDWRVVCC